MRAEMPVRNQLEEKRKRLLIGRRNDGVGSFDALSILLDSQRGVLSGAEFERSAGVDAHGPEIRRKVPALENCGLIVLIRGGGHAHFSHRIHSVSAKKSNAERS